MDLSRHPHLKAWREQMNARQPGDPVPPCPTPATDPDGRPYGTAFCERMDPLIEQERRRQEALRRVAEADETQRTGQQRLLR